MTSPFENVDTADIARMISENPLAWIVPAADPSTAILMPVLIECDDDGQPTHLLGHFPKSAPATQLLADHPNATVLFLGPNAYIAPATVSKPDWAPTWNFVSVKAVGDITLDSSLTSEAVQRLVDHMEAPSGSQWSVEDMGPRFDQLLEHIVGFRMSIETLSPRFKTGQDEASKSLQEIKQGLGEHLLAQWMK